MVEVSVAQAADSPVDDVEAVGERVVVGDVEEAARRDQGGHRAGPGIDVRDPLYDAGSGVDDVEGLAGQCLARPADLGGDEARGAYPCPLGQAHRGVQGGPGEIQPGDDGPAPGPGQGVKADVAHQVQQALAPHVADLAWLERAQRVPSGQEPWNVVEPAGGVRRCPLVPPGPVQPQPVVRR